ncbi:20738_t:CDS:2, partial [Cetraspora pellucida]
MAEKIRGQVIVQNNQKSPDSELFLPPCYLTNQIAKQFLIEDETMAIDGNFSLTDKDYEIPENLQIHLEKAIEDVKKSPSKLEHEELEKYLQEINKKLKDFNENALKIDFNYIIDLKFEILSDLANLKAALNGKLNYINLKSTFSDKINLSVGEIDKINDFLSKWINRTKTIPFEEIYEGLSKFNNFVNNMEDSLFFFEIQEKLLAKITEIKETLPYKSEEIDKPYKPYKSTKQKKDKWGIFSTTKNTKEIPPNEVQNEVYSDFLLIIGLKLAYDLTTELEYTTSRLKLLDPTIQKIIVILKKLHDEFDKLQSSEELVESFERSELYVRECCFYDV